ncbi:CD5 antigen-like [Hemitrygon akajei]|uniref:CD5 antigen-like n=1 Tax=Hemitrygon akajei TaxID=2704970 RepID=UPI003BF9619D
MDILEGCPVLQWDIDSLPNWAEKWRMEFNRDKCEIVHFSRSNVKAEYSIYGLVDRDVVLADGGSPCAGRVEASIFENNFFSFCGRNYEMNDAQVLCKYLGCGDAVSATGNSQFGAGQKGPRLVGGENACSGRVEVLRGETWGTVCDAYWDLKDAAVVCNHLHCGKALSAPVGAFFGQGTGMIWNDINECRGNEMRLNECLIASWGQQQCTHDRDASVICSDNIPVRLMNGGSRCAGRVEVYYNGSWGTICDDAWDLTDAHVACKEMNCGFAVNATVSSWFGQGAGPIWMDNLNCSTNTSALWKCPSRPWGDNNCIHKEDAGVICSDHRDIRLVNGKNPCQGRLEVLFNGTWGTVCSDLFGIENAQAVCSQLSCGSAISVVDKGTFGEGTGPIWLDDIRCRFEDSLLWQCPSSAWGQHNCRHQEDVGIICSELRPPKHRIDWAKVKKVVDPFPEDSDLRLVAGFDNCSGRVEVFFRETWGTVCDDSWDSPDAVVVCYLPKAAPFSYLRAFIYVIPCIIGSLSVIVSLYLVKVLRRHFWDGSRKSQPSITGVPGPFYEEIGFQETGPELDSPSQITAQSVEYDVDDDVNAHKYENE